MVSSWHANRRLFAYLLSFIEIVMCVIYCVLVRLEVQDNPDFNPFYYTYFQDIHVMVLVGFGFLYTFIRRYAWSTLAYTFFINSAVIQLYILIAGFWDRVFFGWNRKYILITERTFISAEYCVASVLIAFGAVLGRVGPLELLIMAIVQVIGYSLDEIIIYRILHMYDAGGSTVIHLFGAYFAMTAIYILGRRVPAHQKPKITYISNVFALIGTFFLFIFWPSINAGFFAQTPFERRIIIINTILALTASNLACFIMTALLQKKFFIDHIENATLAGGVIIGASAGLLTNPGANLIIGAVGGIVASLGYTYLYDFFKDKMGMHDTAGIHNVHGIPGILGGLISAAVIAAYNSDPLTNPVEISSLTFYSNPVNGRSFIAQGAIQVAGTFVSLGIAIIFGIIAGLLMSIFYKDYSPNQFYNDYFNFEQVAMLHEVGAKSSPLLNRSPSPQIMIRGHASRQAIEQMGLDQEEGV